MASSRLLPASELKAHPGFQQLEWDLPPTKQGRCQVAKGRGGPFELYYEVHGAEPGDAESVKIVVSFFFRFLIFWVWWGCGCRLV